MEYAIKTSDITFSYSKGNEILKNLNLRIPKGSIYGFLGPNGSGKTTTIRVILGLLNVSKGSISILGEDIEKSRLSVLSNIGTLIESPSLYEHLTALNNLKITSNYRGNLAKDRINEVLEIVNLSHAKFKKVKTFSLGMKQRLGIAISLLSNPKLLILDEPTNGLDPKGILEMRNLIIELNQNERTTVLISSHLLSEIEKMCSHVGVINNGQLVFQGSISELRTIKNRQLNILIEVDDSKRALKILSTKHNNVSSSKNNVIQFKIKSRELIPKIIRELQKENITVYQFKIEENLENLFLNLTK